MKIRIPALALFLAAFLGGCVTADRLNNVHIGMTKDQITSLLGQPDSTSAQANIEYLTYYFAAESGNGRDQPYSVRLVDGKVESFGRFAQLFDIYNRPVNGAQPGAANLVMPMPMPVPATVAPAALGSELEKLKALKDQGALTEQEYERAKQKLLAP